MSKPKVEVQKDCYPKNQEDLTIVFQVKRPMYLHEEGPNTWVGECNGLILEARTREKLINSTIDILEEHYANL